MTEYTYSSIFKMYFKYETIPIDYDTTVVLKYMLRDKDWKPVGKYPEMDACMTRAKNREETITFEEFERLQALDNFIEMRYN